MFFDALKNINYKSNFTFETTRGNNAIKNAKFNIKFLINILKIINNRWKYNLNNKTALITGASGLLGTKHYDLIKVELSM